MTYYIDILVADETADSVKSPVIPRQGELVFTRFNKYKVLEVAYYYETDDVLRDVMLVCEVIV